MSSRGAVSRGAQPQHRPSLYHTLLPTRVCGQEFFGNVTSIFDGVLFDRSVSAVNTTVVRELVARKHRLVLYVSAYHNFTGPAGSPYAMDGCGIDNKLGDKLWDEPASLPEVIESFRVAPARVAQDTAHNMFYLRSLAGDATHTQQM